MYCNVGKLMLLTDMEAPRSRSLAKVLSSMQSTWSIHPGQQRWDTLWSIIQSEAYPSQTKHSCIKYIFQKEQIWEIKTHQEMFEFWEISHPYLTNLIGIQVRSFNKQNRKYALEFLDDEKTQISISEKNVFVFSKEPDFEVPESHKRNWSKYQSMASDIFGKWNLD